MVSKPPYTLIAKIGRGGMAEVFKAIKTGPDGFEKTVALKKILPFYTDHPKFISMLSMEAKIHSQLDHPNIVQLYDFFQFEQQYMIAMEYVDGFNAKELILACKKKSIALDWQACVYIISEVLKALQYAHAKKDKDGPMGIVHRDISPHNILISMDGRIKLTDFGIANAKMKEDKTKSGVLKGKYRYLAPEQVTGESVSHQTDLFSSGVTLYELLCFIHPFGHDQELELLQSIVQADYTPIVDLCPDLPIELQDALLLAMQPETQDRFPDAKAFLDALLEVQTPQWLSRGEEQLAKLMNKAFPAQERIEIPIEETKVLSHSHATNLSIETEKSLINEQAPTTTSRKTTRPLLFSLILGALAVGMIFYSMPKSNKDTGTITFQDTSTQKQVKQPLEAMKKTVVTEVQKENPQGETTQSMPDKKTVNPTLTSNSSPKPATKKTLKKKSAPPTVQRTSSKLGILTFSGKAGTEVLVNGKKIGSLPMKQYFLTAGKYIVLLKNKDNQILKPITIESGQSQHVTLD